MIVRAGERWLGVLGLQNLYLSLAVIALLIFATTTGLFGIGPAVIEHEGSTLVVIANALRLLLFEGEGRRQTAHGSSAILA